MKYGGFKYIPPFEVYRLLIYIAPVNAMPPLIRGDFAMTLRIHLRRQGGGAMNRPFKFYSHTLLLSYRTSPSSYLPCP